MRCRRARFKLPDDFGQSAKAEAAACQQDQQPKHREPKRAGPQYKEPKPQEPKPDRMKIGFAMLTEVGAPHFLQVGPARVNM